MSLSLLSTHQPVRPDPVAAARTLLPRLAERAPAADREGRFSFDNIADLHQAGLTALVVPAAYGGSDASFDEVIEVIGLVAQGDPSTALVLLMQTLHHRAIQANDTWPQDIQAMVFKAAVERGALINALRVEPELGSPVRGGKPATTAVKVDGGWLISGRKLYSTGSPGLTWGIVWGAADEPQGRIGEFLVPLDAPGVRIEPTWDHLGLRASGSHDVVFERVWIADDHAVDLRTPDEWKRQEIGLNAWLPVMLGALYDGVARAARDWLLGWLNARVPSNLGKPLSQVPRIRHAVGEIEAWLQANAALLQLARQRIGQGAALPLDPALLKYTVTSNAIAAVEKAVSLIGNHGLTHANPLQRHYRDVLCSRVHQPQNDLILEGSGQLALDRHPH